MYKNLTELKTNLDHVFTFHDPQIKIHKPEKVASIIDKIIYTSVFTKDESLQIKTRKIIHLLAKEVGVLSSSIQPLYKAFADGKAHGFTVPAMNLRMLTYDVARAIFRIAKEKNAGAFIIEIAKTESEYTDQEPSEFITVVLAAAIKESYQYPVFIQGDHCQFSAWRYKKDKEVELTRVKDWVTLLLDAGFRNIDIDGSTLVDLTKPSLTAQQKDNSHVTAEMTKFIREYEKKLQNHKTRKLQDSLSDSPTIKLPISPIAIGGEIGHIGEKNSTADDFEAFMKQYLNKIPLKSGLSKVSVQTGTSHGGVVNPDGTVQKMAVDFSVIESVGKVAREKYHLAGPVQHGASTLPMDSFHKFVSSKTAEIHLSTGFQNLVYDKMPKKLRDEMYAWLKLNLKEEWKESWTEDQFIYKTRKKAWGPFKKQTWDLSETEKAPIIEAMEKYVAEIFDQLHIEGTMEQVREYCK